MRQVTTYLAIRPARAVVLVPVYSDVPWQVSMLCALRAQSRFWGGSGAIVLPPPRALDDQLFWALAQAQDPDAFVVHPGTWGELRDFVPEAFTAAEQRVRKELTEKGFTGSVTDKEVDRWRDEALSTPAVESDLAAELIRRLAPFHHSDYPDTIGSWVRSAPGFPFTDAFALRGLPERATSPHTDDLNDAVQLAAEVGSWSQDQEEAARSRGLNVQDVTLDSETTRQMLFRPEERPAGAMPHTVSEAGLSWFSTSPLPPSRAILVAGDTAWDFALFYALRRLTAATFWLPTSYLGDRSALFALINRINNPDVEETVVTSADSSAAAAAVLAALRELPFDGAQARDWEDLIPRDPRRLLATDSYGIGQPTLLNDVAISAQLPTPMPTMRAQREHETRWITDVRVDGWQPVSNPYLGPAVVEAATYGTETTRATRVGAAYFCPHHIWFGGDLEGGTVRPRLHELGLIDQVRRILTREDWRCEPSDKGIYAAATADLFGGLTDLAAALVDPTWDRVLRCLRSDKRGLGLKDGRRYADLATLLDAAEDWTAQDVQETVDRGIIGRGLIHKCSVCRWASWYDQSEIGGDLRCGRCPARATLGDLNWIGDGEPRWYYRLAEVAWQFLAANGDLPLRGIFQEIWSDDVAMAATPELDLWAPGADSPIEIDICVQRGPDLWIGEAKVSPKLGTVAEEKAKLSKLAQVAAIVGAHGVLFVTAADEFQPKTQGRITGKFPRGRIPRAVMTSVQS
jgi:hypothetical protein